MAMAGAFIVMLASLASASASLPTGQESDWLVSRNPPISTALSMSADGKMLSLANGLIERSFFVGSAGAFCTVEYRHMITGQTFFRGLSPEANITLSGTAFDVGACAGQPTGHFEFFDRDATLPSLAVDPAAFRLVNYTTAAPQELFPWKPGQRHAPRDIAWPPRGVRLSALFEAPAGASASASSSASSAAAGDVQVTIHYEMYDGLPVLRKWLEVRRVRAASGAAPVVVDTMAMEILRAPNLAPPRMSIVLEQANNPTPLDDQVVPELGQSFPGRMKQLWFMDPLYDQGGDQELHVTYTYYTMLVVGYGFNVRYGGATGPGAALAAVGDAFRSLSVREVLHDSNDPDRKGLGVRAMAAALSPQLLENPINFMITDISTDAAFKLAIDQAASTGHELVIVGFGAAGYCGLCDAQMLNATWVSWFKGHVDYGRSVGVELSAYTLMQHNGWGESVPAQWQTLNRDGGRGPTACFATTWHAQYRQHVLDFINATGMGGLETDGQYESIPCGDPTHDHNGFAGGWSAQLEATLDFNIKLKGLGVYQTGADAYSFSGANKWNHADTDAFGRLPTWEQHTVGRMYTHDSTLTRLPSSGTIGVNDLAATSKSCGGGRARLQCFDAILAGYYGLGIIPNFRAAKLWDPADAEAGGLSASIRHWTAFYRQHAAARPSGAPGVLLATRTVHLHRPDSRSLEAVVHLSADDSAPTRALVSLFNPTRRTLRQNVSVPLYYAGLAPGVEVRVAQLPGPSLPGLPPPTVAAPANYTLGSGNAALYSIVLPIVQAPSSYSMFSISV